MDRFIGWLLRFLVGRQSGVVTGCGLVKSRKLTNYVYGDGPPVTPRPTFRDELMKTPEGRLRLLRANNQVGVDLGGPERAAACGDREAQSVPKFQGRKLKNRVSEQPAVASLVVFAVLAVLWPASLLFSVPFWLGFVALRKARKIRWHSPDFTPAGIICGWGERPITPRPRRTVSGEDGHE